MAIGISSCKEIERQENRYVDRKMESIDQRIFKKNVAEYDFLMKNGKALDQEIAADMVRLSCIALKDSACVAKWTRLAKEASGRR